MVVDALSEWLNRPVDFWWTIVAVATGTLLGLALVAFWALRSDRRDQRHHEEWLRQFKAGEVR